MVSPKNIALFNFMTPERYTRLRTILDQRQPDLTVLTDYVHKGRNLSAIVRTADAVGIGSVHCVVGDKDYRSFRGTALGSHRYVEVHRYTELNQPVTALKSRGFQVVAAHVSATAVDYHEVDYTAPTVLLMGAEKNGLSADGLEAADIHITVPMVGMVESFNVSVAAGIILNEARHQRQIAGCYDRQRLSQQEYNRLFFEWAHPKVCDYCRRYGFDYPILSDDGEIANAAIWYAETRQLLMDKVAAMENVNG